MLQGFLFILEQRWLHDFPLNRDVNSATFEMLNWKPNALNTKETYITLYYLRYLTTSLTFRRSVLREAVIN